MMVFITQRGEINTEEILGSQLKKISLEVWNKKKIKPITFNNEVVG